MCLPCVQGHNAQAQKERMHSQEAEISALRRQLESMQVASSRARAGGAGRRQYDGSVPAEYICPITQVRVLHLYALALVLHGVPRKLKNVYSKCKVILYALSNWTEDSPTSPLMQMSSDRSSGLIDTGRRHACPKAPLLHDYADLQ